MKQQFSLKFLVALTLYTGAFMGLNMMPSDIVYDRGITRVKSTSYGWPIYLYETNAKIVAFIDGDDLDSRGPRGLSLLGMLVNGWAYGFGSILLFIFFRLTRASRNSAEQNEKSGKTG